MDEQEYHRITIHNSHAISYYSEQETAEYCQLEIQVIRQLTTVGVIKGTAIVGEEQRYNNEDIALLRRARRLLQDLNINLEGVEVILRLSARVEELQRELEQYKRTAS